MPGQNPETHPHSTAGNSWLPCIIKKCGIMFSLKHKRWLTGKELLAIHGYPIYESIFGESSSFNEERSAHGLRERCRGVIMQQAGNGMSLAAVAVPLAWALSQRVILNQAAGKRASSKAKRILTICDSLSTEDDLDENIRRDKKERRDLLKIFRMPVGESSGSAKRHCPGTGG